MINGIHGLTVERGIDPAGYLLSDCGGALGVHIARIGHELGVDSIVLPKQAVVVSALEGTVSQLRHNFTASHRTASNCFDTDRANDTLATLEQRGEAFLERVGVPAAERQYRYSVESRYEEQVWQLQFELPNSRVDDDDVADLVERFHSAHEETYGSGRLIRRSSIPRGELRSVVRPKLNWPLQRRRRHRVNHNPTGSKRPTSSENRRRVRPIEVTRCDLVTGSQGQPSSTRGILQ